MSGAWKALAAIGMVAQITSNTCEARAAEQTIVLFNKCLSYAIEHNHVTKSGNTLEYLCGDRIAEQLFNHLVRSGFGKTNIADELSGSYVHVDIGSDRSGCSHRIEDADGTAASDFSCMISVKGPGN